MFIWFEWQSRTTLNVISEILSHSCASQTCSCLAVIYWITTTHHVPELFAWTYSWSCQMSDPIYRPLMHMPPTSCPNVLVYMLGYTYVHEVAALQLHRYCHCWMCSDLCTCTIRTYVTYKHTHIDLLTSNKIWVHRYMCMWEIVPCMWYPVYRDCYIWCLHSPHTLQK